VNLADCRDLASLHAQLDRLRDSQNVFYAVRVDGEFDAVQTRSVRPTPEGVPLVQAASRQQEYQLAGVRGTLVGFWSPGYLRTILVPGTTSTSSPTTGGRAAICSAARAGSFAPGCGERPTSASPCQSRPRSFEPT
jgi:hypothetical protein